MSLLRYKKKQKKALNDKIYNFDFYWSMGSKKLSLIIITM
jgi:hypothetical protein